MKGSRIPYNAWIYFTSTTRSLTQDKHFFDYEILLFSMVLFSMVLQQICSYVLERYTILPTL
jgi:hypothetical protein